MAEQPRKPEERLKDYFEASTKYAGVPVPSGLDSADVVAFVQQHVKPDETVRRMRKLARLAEVYDARDCAAAFADILKLTEQNEMDFARSAVAVGAIGWLGDDGEWTTAQGYFHGMLTRAHHDGLRDVFKQACFFLGPKETTDELKKWAEQRRAVLLARAAKAPQADAEQLELAVDDMDEFIRLELPRLEQSAALRSNMATVSEPASRAARLVALHLREPEQATPQLSYWAALSLIRTAGAQAANRDPIIAECLKAAQRYDKTTATRQEEFDIGRATLLRAAVFFGHELGEEDRKWLETQEDSGADVLALRPEWDYGVTPVK